MVENTSESTISHVSEKRLLLHFEVTISCDLHEVSSLLDKLLPDALSNSNESLILIFGTSKKKTQGIHGYKEYGAPFA